MALTSMTAYAVQETVFAGCSWIWEVRSDIGGALELRLRLPEGTDRLDPMVRKQVAAAVRRGTVTVTLRIGGPDSQGGMPDADQLDRLFEQVATVQAMAARAGLRLVPLTVADVLGGRLVTAVQPWNRPGSRDLAEALQPGLQAALDRLITLRKADGLRIWRMVSAQVSRIGELVAEARVTEGERGLARSEALTAALRRVIAHRAEIEPARIAQELALIAVRADVTAEIERLESLAAAAREALSGTAPAGYRLGLLAEEMARETNALCDKAQFAALTRVGLDLKAAIDQVREQVQNVE